MSLRLYIPIRIVHREDNPLHRLPHSALHHHSHTLIYRLSESLLDHPRYTFVYSLPHLLCDSGVCKADGPFEICKRLKMILSLGLLEGFDLVIDAREGNGEVMIEGVGRGRWHCLEIVHGNCVLVHGHGQWVGHGGCFFALALRRKKRTKETFG